MQVSSETRQTWQTRVSRFFLQKHWNKSEYSFLRNKENKLRVECGQTRDRLEKLFVIIALTIVTEFLARVPSERCCLASRSVSARNASGCSFLYAALERSSLVTFWPGIYYPFLTILVNTRVQGHIKFAHETWDMYLINTFRCACMQELRILFMYADKTAEISNLINNLEFENLCSIEYTYRHYFRMIFLIFPEKDPEIYIL